MIWVVVESALVCSGTSRSRGRLLAAYMMVYYVGTVLGQLMVSKLPTDLMSVLPWVTGLALAAILPLLFTRIMGQAEEPHETVRIWPMLKLRQARHGSMAVFRDCPRLAVWPDAAVAEPSGRQRLRHRLLDGGDGECGDPRPMAGRAPADRYGRLLCCGYRSLWSFWDVWRCLVRRQWPRRCLCLGHLVSRCIRWRWPGPVKSGAPSAGGDESGAADELYHRQPAGPDPDGDADAELLRQPAVYHDRQRVVYLSADPAAQSRASSDAGGARLTLQRAAHAARHLLQSHRLTAAEDKSFS